MWSSLHHSLFSCRLDREHTKSRVEAKGALISLRAPFYFRATESNNAETPRCRGERRAFHTEGTEEKKRCYGWSEFRGFLRCDPWSQKRSSG